jgi:hypothetical protein
MATLVGFEPTFSTLKGWRAGPLHHRVKRGQCRQLSCRPALNRAEYLTPSGTKPFTALSELVIDRVDRHVRGGAAAQPEGREDQE